MGSRDPAIAAAVALLPFHALTAGVCFVQPSGKREEIKHGNPLRNRRVPARDPKVDTEEKHTVTCENRSALSGHEMVRPILFLYEAHQYTPSSNPSILLEKCGGVGLE